MKTEIFITSYPPDRQWLEFNLRSIRKFATGFSGVTVVVPFVDVDSFADLAKRYDVTLRGRKSWRDKTDDHNQHQVAKLSADSYCPHADLILHTDSDCIFCVPVQPEDYFQFGKPELLIDSWEHVGGASTWKKGVDFGLGIDSKFETMRRHPAVHYAGVYADLRRHLEKLHNNTLERYFIQPWLPDSRPSEFNLLGNFVLMKPEWRERYHVIDLSNEPAPASSKKLIQFWSPSPPDKPQRSPVDGAISIPAEVIGRILT